MRSNNKKGLMVGVIVALLLVVTLGVTFAIWNYSRVGDNQILVTGDIYMKFKENNTLTIPNALPREEYIPDKYFEFTVEGVNKYSKDIHYQILLSEGDAPTGDENKDRTERIRPDLLLFKLVEVENGEEKDIIFDRMSYPELDNTSVWVDTIKAKTNTKTSKTYRLYMWISPLTKIGVGDNLDYEMDTWNNNVYGSVKVTVQGDFDEKEAFSCFSGSITATATYNEQRTDEQVNACVEWMTEGVFGPEEEAPLQDGESYKGFCEGTGTINGMTFQFALSAWPSNFLQELSEIGIVKDVKITKEKYDGTNLDYDDRCQKDVVIPSVIDKVKVAEINERVFIGNQLTSVNIPNSVTTIESYAFAENQLTSVNIPNSVTIIGINAFASNQLTSVNIPNSVTKIGNRAFYNNQLTSVNIPNSVTTIGIQAFAGNNLISLNISEGVESIEYQAFAGNNLTKVNIPNSVTTIGENAFHANKLEEVSIGNGIKEIGAGAFSKLAGSTIKPENKNENLKSITIDKTCNEIKSIPNYAWLTPDNQTFLRQGTTIYGSNGEVCDSY